MAKKQESKAIADARDKLESYEKGLNFVKDLIVDFLKQEELKNRFYKMESIIKDIRTSIDSMNSVHHEDQYLEEYFGQKLDNLKSMALKLLSDLSLTEIGIGSQKLSQYFQTRIEPLKNSIEDKPMLSTALAFIAGILVSTILRSSK